jgi:hypothetical protein
VEEKRNIPPSPRVKKCVSEIKSVWHFDELSCDETVFHNPETRQPPAKSADVAESDKAGHPAASASARPVPVVPNRLLPAPVAIAVQQQSRPALGEDSVTQS